MVSKGREGSRGRRKEIFVVLLIRFIKYIMYVSMVTGRKKLSGKYISLCYTHVVNIILRDVLVTLFSIFLPSERIACEEYFQHF